MLPPNARRRVAVRRPAMWTPVRVDVSIVERTFESSMPEPSMAGLAPTGKSEKIPGPIRHPVVSSDESIDDLPHG
jgi:hypothetical protein